MAKWDDWEDLVDDNDPGEELGPSEETLAYRREQLVEESNKIVQVWFDEDRGRTNEEASLNLVMLAGTDSNGVKQVPVAWQHFPSARSIRGPKKSKESIETIKAWLLDCEANHASDSCGSAILGVGLPTRILDVGNLGGKNDIRLMNSMGTMGTYIALSHCWGRTQVITTTSKTCQARTECIPMEYLSKTFREAVEICRALKIRYLWIDSLCIIQDDPQDWASEAGIMANVYQFAYLTLAATSSQSGDQGLFRDNECIYVSDEPDGGSPYRFCFRRRFDHVWQYFGSALGTGELLEGPSESFPLLERAWVL
ncbi:Nn.00g038980.m01.CDS01 [Neocucurbitaria sp. VM-36]